MQEIDLGVHEAPIALPAAICAQAVQANCFSIVGVLVNPQKQNMRALIGQMPRLWELSDEVVGRIVEPRKFQFVFRSEEALNLVLRRGPWSFSEWMLDLKIIPFWVQIRGIPSQFLNRRMVEFIADIIGHVRDIEFDEVANLTDFVRAKIDWNIDHPLKFQRNFQFSPNENTTLKFRYEKLWNFCVKCGMLSHEFKDCPQNDPEDDIPDPPVDPHDPENNGDEDQSTPPDAPVPDAATHTAPVTRMEFPKEESCNNDCPGSSSAAVECKSFIPHFDTDMPAETIRYIKAKLVKGKFQKGELRTWLQLLDKAKEIPEETKIRQMIPPLSGFVRFTVMSPDWSVPKDHDAFYNPMEPRMPEEEYMSGFDEYVKEYEDFFVKKRKRVEIVDWDIEDSPTSWLDLLPVCKKEKIESIDSCSYDDYGG
ncbi:hypothetical protein Bca52824_017739 [Brassica carinata]|uniref:CCHC-type domain-containing protein n=1 Tax=Brassica carinata TaxID=52824 RepID=A0A8X8AXP8_BRACI|nr:hypothetical protein Bca52824_017739 [Brassica carinata]